MADVILGTIGVDDVAPSKRAQDFTKSISTKYQDLSPLLSVQMKISKAQPIVNPRFEWAFRDELPTVDAVTAAAGGGATSITLSVANAAYFLVDDTVILTDATPAANETKYGVVTAADVAAGTITLTAFEYTTAGALKVFPAVANGDEVFIYADSRGGSSGLATARVVKDTIFDNYPQFLKASIDIDVWSQGQENNTGIREYKERVKEQYDNIRRKIENVLIWGQKGYNVTAAGKQYFSAGAMAQVEFGAPENVGSLPTAFTEAQLDEYFVEGPAASGVGSNKRFLFAGSDLYLHINGIMKDKQELNALSTVPAVGLNFQKYILPTGKEVYLYNHPGFTGGNSTKGLVVDPSQAKIRNYRDNGVLMLKEGLEKGENRSGLISQWQSIVAYQILNIKSAGVIEMV